jgi:hypothetical protein
VNQHLYQVMRSYIENMKSIQTVKAVWIGIAKSYFAA